jgi:hypothetical protein
MSYYTHYLLSQTVPTPPRRAYQPRRRLLLRVAPPPPPLPASVRRRMLRRADHLAPPSPIRRAGHLPSLLQSVVGAAPVLARGNPAPPREDLVPLCRIRGGGGADGRCSWREVVGGSGGVW